MPEFFLSFSSPTGRENELDQDPYTVTTLTMPPFYTHTSVFVFDGEDQTQGLVHPKHMLYL